MRNYEQAAIVTGVLLRERKRRLKHGEWLPWLEAHFEGDQKTAWRYVQLAEQHVPNQAPTPNLEATSEHPDTPTPEYEQEPEEVDGEPVFDPDGPSFGGGVANGPDFRGELVSWFAQGRVVSRLLNDGAADVVPQELRSDVELMIAIANRIKEEWCT